MRRISDPDARVHDKSRSRGPSPLFVFLNHTQCCSVLTPGSVLRHQFRQESHMRWLDPVHARQHPISHTMAQTHSPLFISVPFPILTPLHYYVNYLTTLTHSLLHSVIHSPNSCSSGLFKMQIWSRHIGHKWLHLAQGIKNNMFYGSTRTMGCVSLSLVSFYIVGPCFFPI